MEDPADSTEPADPVAIQKIAEGHEQVQQARQADLELLQEGLASLKQTQQRLDQDLQTLTDYGFSAPQRFILMAQDLAVGTKALEHAAEVTLHLKQNNSVLTPDNRRGGGAA
jgi:hypothetical protein